MDDINSKHMTIGFIGLGHMGGPMAANLVKSGHVVRGFDLIPDLLQAATGTGVTPCRSVVETVEGCNVVITMLPAGKHVISVWTDLMTVVSEGTLLIDCSTIDIESSRHVHAMAKARGCPSLDAPVSGGTSGAMAGTLTFMVGGESEAFTAAEPILRPMGQKIIHCGGAAMGQAAKMCNNMILGISMIAVSEAFVLAEKLGLSQQSLYDVASVSSGQCWSLTTYCPVPGPVPASPANRDYQPGFATALMLKDLMLSQDAAALTGAKTQLGHEAAALYQRFSDAGGTAKDFSAIIEMIRSET
jgi:3-hydroxyisobutyrate dehydrogenase